MSQPSDVAVSSSTGNVVSHPDGRPVWLPLESDPDIMTDYLRMITLTDHYLIDVPVIDGAEEMGIFAGHDVKSFIFLYEINKKTESETTEAANQPDAPADLFHLQQLIHNACGSVALFHAYLNTVDKSLFNQDSIMYKYYWDNVENSFEKRGEAFANSEEIRNLHHQQARQGQSNVPEGQQLNNINYHFVAIISKSGAVYKMDGRCPKPVKMGDVVEGNFIAAGLEAIKTLIARDPDNYNFSILAFCGK